MTALSKFFETQRALGRASIVATCTMIALTINPLIAQAQDAQSFVVTQDVNGQQVHKSFPRSQLHDVLEKMNGIVDKDLETIGQLNTALDKIGNSHLSIDQKVAQIREKAKKALDVLNADEKMRATYAQIQTSNNNDPVRDADVLATRSNRLVDFADKATMTLEELLVALDDHNLKIIDRAYRALDNLYGEQKSIETGLNQMGFTVKDALAQVK